jgi:hypothetical protein
MGENAGVYRDKITEEILHAFGFSRRGAMRRLLGPVFRFPAGRFAGVMARADDEIRRSGLSGGSRRVLADLSLRPEARGQDAIPAEGPLLLVSNHPGAYDSVAIMSFVPRKDLKVILSDVPFTRALSAARSYFIYAPHNTPGRVAALRASLEHLQNGGALLVFAHVDVEPDPETSPGALEAIEDWSRSVEIMLRGVPETRLEVTIASGVLMTRFLNSALVKIRRSGPKRQKLAEFLQVSRQMVFPRSVRPGIHISFGPPVRGTELPGEDLMRAVIETARRLLVDHLAYFRKTPG